MNNMDFKSLLNKLDSMEAPVVTPAAPKLAEAVQLNEDAQLRVLSGRSTYVAEAKKKAEDEKVKEGFPTVADAKARAEKEKTTGKFDKKQTSTGTQYTRKASTFTDGGDDADTKAAKKKAKKESIEPEFKSKFMKMVEAKKMEADKKKADAKKKKMDEAAKPDFLDIDNDGDEKETMKDAAADKKAGNKGDDKKDSGKKGMSDKQAKYFGKKKTVKESVEPKLSFKQMIKLVQESGGQQAIDPTDKELFAWATRIAQNKFVNEGMKAEVYAGLVYERMGGVFEMYDVLSEDKK
jgi:hypothetical protein